MARQNSRPEAPAAPTESSPTPDRDGPPAAAPEPVDDLIARAQAEKAAADDQRHRERAEDKRRAALLDHLLAARSRTLSDGGPRTDAENWVVLLHCLFATAAPDAGDVAGRLLERDDARRVVKHACGLVRADPDRAVQVLAGAFDSTLAPALWQDLSRHLPDDVAALLPDDLPSEYERLRDGPARATAAVAPLVPLMGSVPRSPRLAVDLECKTITLDGTVHDKIKSDLALRWLKVLAGHPGRWLTSSELKQYDPELDFDRKTRGGVRTDRLKKLLPDAVLALIETDTTRGSRIRL
jgi:hypothetical protein